MRPNFELITELQTLTRRDFPLAAPAILQPTGASPLVDGEWLQLNSSYQLERGSGSASTLVFPVHTERGRYDTQAIGKVNVLYLGMYEAEVSPTNFIVTVSGLALGDALVVADISTGTFNRRGLVEKTGAGTVVGYVSKVYADGSKVRFIHFGNQYFAA
jgi:hypothetical protein